MFVYGSAVTTFCLFVYFLFSFFFEGCVECDAGGKRE